MKNLTVLLLEDNALDAELNQMELKEHLAEFTCTFHWVTNKIDYNRLLETLEPDLVLSDYNIPSYNGLDALRDFRKRFPFTPFIFVTGTQQEEVAADAIKEGAWDFVVKDRLSRLTMVVRNAITLRSEQLKNIAIQNAIVKSELRFRTLFNAASDAIFMMRGSSIIDCNDAAERIFGFTKKEMVGMTPCNLSPTHQPSGQQSEEASLAKIQLAMAGESLIFEWQQQRADGTLFDGEVTLNRIDIEEEVFLQAFVRDITERKQSQRALAESEQRFRNLVEQSPLAIIEWDTQLNVREWNKGAENIFGFTRNEALGESAYHLIVREDDSSVVGSVTNNLLKKEGGERSRNRNFTKTGKQIICEWYNRTLLAEDGSVSSIISMVEDVTDRLKAEGELKESELKFRQIIQSSPMGIYVYEARPNGALVLVDTNTAADEHTGIENVKLIGMTIEEAFPALRHTEVPQRYMEAATQGTPWFTEDIQYHEGNISGAFQVYAFQAGYNRMAVMFLNVTERRLIEENVKQKNAELLKTNAELDRFVYSASHDLRAPIASLLGLVEVARMEDTVDGMVGLLDMQKRSLVKLDSFIHDIVNYSRNNRLEVQADEIDFKSMILESFEQLHFMDQLDYIECKVSVANDLLFINDRQRTSVILNNLISNAIKYADVEKSKPFIEVRVEKCDKGIHLYVADNGDGIGEEQLPKIFDMFYRATLRSTGSGIGLYIVNEIIQKMHGHITVSSETGVGTTFKVMLPTAV